MCLTYFIHWSLFSMSQCRFAQQNIFTFTSIPLTVRLIPIYTTLHDKWQTFNRICLCNIQYCLCGGAILPSIGMYLYIQRWLSLISNRTHYALRFPIVFWAHPCHFHPHFIPWYYMCRYNMRHITSTHVVAAMKFSKAHKLHKRVVRRVVHVLVLLCLIT